MDNIIRIKPSDINQIMEILEFLRINGFDMKYVYGLVMFSNENGLYNITIVKNDKKVYMTSPDSTTETITFTEFKEIMNGYTKTYTVEDSIKMLTKLNEALLLNEKVVYIGSIREYCRVTGYTIEHYTSFGDVIKLHGYNDTNKEIHEICNGLLHIILPKIRILTDVTVTTKKDLMGNESV